MSRPGPAIIYSRNGVERSVASGDPVGTTQGGVAAGTDGSNARFTHTATDGTQQIVFSNIVSAGNSWYAPLTAGGVFVGSGDDVSGFSSIIVNLYADAISDTLGLSVEWSSDGTNWDRTEKRTVLPDTRLLLNYAVKARFFRIVYTNGPTDQANFRLQAIYSNASPEMTRPSGLADTPGAGMAAADRIGRSIMVQAERVPVFYENWWQFGFGSWFDAWSSGGSASYSSQKATLTQTSTTSYVRLGTMPRWGPQGDSAIEVRWAMRMATATGQVGREIKVTAGFYYFPVTSTYATPANDGVFIQYDANGTDSAVNIGALGTATKNMSVFPDNNWHQYRMIWHRTGVIVYVDDMVTPVAVFDLATDPNILLASDTYPFVICLTRGTDAGANVSLEIGTVTIYRQPGGDVSPIDTTGIAYFDGGKSTTGVFRACTDVLTGSASQQVLMSIRNTQTVGGRRLFLHSVKVQSQSAVVDVTDFSFGLYQLTGSPSGGTTLTSVKSFYSGFQPATIASVLQAPTTATPTGGPTHSFIPGYQIGLDSASRPVQGSLGRAIANFDQSYVVSWGEAVAVVVSANSTNWRHVVSALWSEAWDDTFNS